MFLPRFGYLGYSHDFFFLFVIVILYKFDLEGQLNIQQMDIGTIIKEARLKIGMSQKDLATQIGCDVSFLCKIEKNEKKISLEKLKLICDILKIENNMLKEEYYFQKINLLFVNEEIEFKNRVLKMMIE